MVVSLRGVDYFVLSYGIQDRTPIFLALKVSFRVVREDIKNAVILCRPSRPIWDRKWYIKKTLSHAQTGLL